METFTNPHNFPNKISEESSLWRIDSNFLLIMNQQIHFCTRAMHLKAM